MEFSNMFLKFTLKPTQPAQENPAKLAYKPFMKMNKIKV